MQVKELLDLKGHNVISITPDATAHEAMKIMNEKNIGALIVLDEETMVGILTENDYARKIILQGENAQKILIREIMTTDIISTNPDQKIQKCLSIMTKKQIRHIPVLDGNKVVGILSIGDIKKKI